MKNYVFLQDKNGRQRVIRTARPAFTATVHGYYDQADGQCSKSFEHNDGRLKICIDELFHEAPESKINWALNQAIKYYKYVNNQ